jgi:hypothetical protein
VRAGVAGEGGGGRTDGRAERRATSHGEWVEARRRWEMGHSPLGVRVGWMAELKAWTILALIHLSGRSSRRARAAVPPHTAHTTSRGRMHVCTPYTRGAM